MSARANTLGELELVDISKRFGSVDALRDVSLRVPVGETAVLIGESGSGKSSLLRVIIGLLAPDRGELRFDGRPVSYRDTPALRHRIGYVIQEGGLFPHLSALDNITLMARHLAWPKARLEARVEQLARLARLPIDALHRYPLELSGGQRQRVGLMRALMLDPDLLLLDEPLGALDPITRSELQADLREIFASLSKTVVWVTHDLAEAARFGKQLALMRAGEIVQRGSLQDMLERPADPFVTRFVNAQRDPLQWLSAGPPAEGPS